MNFVSTSLIFPVSRSLSILPHAKFCSQRKSLRVSSLLFSEEYAPVVAVMLVQVFTTLVVVSFVTTVKVFPNPGTKPVVRASTVNASRMMYASGTLS